MNTTVITQWINHLRSGTFAQIPKQLKTDDGYCCLGVLCQTQGQGTFTRDPMYSTDFLFHDTYGGTSLATIDVTLWEELTGLPYDIQSLCIKMNDTYEMTFDEIADILTIIVEEPEVIPCLR